MFNVHLFFAVWFSGFSIMFAHLFGRVIDANLIEIDTKEIVLNWLFLAGFSSCWPVTMFIVWYHRRHR